MATYVFGDLQGCLDPTLRLVDRLGLGDDDRLWFAGDLVNRGPRSLETLRWVRALGRQATIVLGNHDLHLLSVAAGRRNLGEKDTIRAVLKAPDRDELLDWLRRRPLLHREGDVIMVHAGLLPRWRAAEAEGWARFAETRLLADDWPDFLDSLQSTPAGDWDALDVADRTRLAAQVLTRVRICDHEGRPDFAYAATLAEVPPDRAPWFRQCTALAEDGVTVICGHWAALGLHREPGLVALDSGCVWGRKLTAYRLEDGAVFQEPCG